MSIAKVIDWKFNSQQGMRCAEIDGILTIVDFPGGIPSQANQDLWTQEYNDYTTELNRIQSIKDEAQIRIIAQLPSGSPDNFIIKQLNLFKRNADLDDIVLNGGALTLGQIEEKEAFRALSAKVDAIRGMSDIAEASGHTIDKFKSDLDLAGL